MDRKTTGDNRENAVEAEAVNNPPRFAPRVDIYERADAMVLLANIPGADADSVEVRFEEKTLTISAQAPGTTSEGYETVLRESEAGEYYRAFTIGEDIDTEHIEADLKDGVLKLVLPKSEKAKPRKIEVKQAHDN